MTVGELIEELTQYNKDVIVTVYGEHTTSVVHLEECSDYPEQVCVE